MPPQKRKEPPSMLQNVVSAISALKDAQGSTVQSIVRQINRGASRGRIKKNGTTIQIRKALQQGSRAGVLVHRAGKYKLASSPVIHSKDIVEAGPAARQKKPPRKRSKIKKSRSRSLSNPSDFPPEEGENDSDDDGEVTERSRSRRRRRRRSRRRRRRREYNEAGLERGSEYEHDVLPRKRLRLSRSRSALGHSEYSDDFENPREDCENPNCPYRKQFKKEEDDKKNSSSDDEDAAQEDDKKH